MNKKIGVFDSGLGGLTVLKELYKAMPDEDFCIFGDTKNVPYGIRPGYEIESLSYAAFKKMEQMGLKAFVIACNTATVYSLKKISSSTDIPVIGVIEPGVMSALENDLEKVLVLATEATIRSGLIEKLLKEGKPSIEVEGIGAPKMVLAVENGLGHSEKGRKIVHSYLDQAKIDPDGVMLSCTHFPVLQDFVVDYYKERGKDIKIIDPAKKCAEIIKGELVREGMLTSEKDKGKVEFFTSGDLDSYKKIGNVILGDTLTINEVKNL